MAYTKHTWENGEVISAEKLNNLEEGIGYELTEEILFEEEATTTQQSGAPFAMGNITYSDFIDADELNIVFNNVEYSLPKNVMNSGERTNVYGELNKETRAPVFDTYPLALVSSNYGNQLATSEPGTYNVKVKVQLIQTTAEFEQAVKKNGVKNIKDGEGNSAITEGSGTKAQGNCSHAEGSGTTASRDSCHAEGAGTTASGRFSHAEGGDKTTASGEYSHAEGQYTTASGYNSHAEGGGTKAQGNYSHAGGDSTIAQGCDQTVIGKYNIAQGTSNSNTSTDYAFIIGNGNNNARSNALAIKWDGTFVFANGTEITPAQFTSILSSISS